MSLNSKSVAVVTGAGSGIGRALAIRFAREKIAGIAISDVDQAGLDETTRKVEELGASVFSSVLDVSKLDDFQKFSEDVLKEFGRATHLVNNAGVGLIGRAEEISIEDIEWLMSINFWGTVYGTKIFLPIFRQQDEGHLINISSVFGFVAPPGQSAYCASKFAVRGFTESLRHELESTNISVSCVHPGGIRTNIAKKARKGEKTPEADKKIAPVIFDKLAKTTPEQAAETIINGIKSKNPRILIGSDARQISLTYRLFPTKYFKILDRMSGGMFSKFK